MEHIAGNTPMDTNLSILIFFATFFSSIIYVRLVRPFIEGLPDELPGIDTILRMLTPEETFRIFEALGLSSLAYSTSYYILIGVYLTNFQNLVQILDLNLNTLDPNYLLSILPQLKFLIINHELIFGVLGRFCTMNEIMDFPFDFDFETYHENVRELGNNVIDLYRRIELVLHISNSDLPEQ